MERTETEKLRKWFLTQKRDLPWRENPTPYAVWVSEIMLQQTQVSVVIPYFERWMEKYPSIEALANASIEDVIKSWEGLGDYARARNLHEGACFVLRKYSGDLPSTKEELSQIKGLGPYTIGAILNFAFQQKAAAVDGNVIRVLTRYYLLNDDISKPKTTKKIQNMALSLLPDHQPWVISEALIELGATVCSRVPKCFECPIKGACKGFLSGNAQNLPFKSQKSTATSLIRGVPVVTCKGKFLVSREEKGKIMAGLYQFPYFEKNDKDSKIHEYENWVKTHLNLRVQWQKTLQEVSHSFTRFRALLKPMLFISQHFQDVRGYEWHSLEELNELPFSSGHKKILQSLPEGD